VFVPGGQRDVEFGAGEVGAEVPEHVRQRRCDGVESGDHEQHE